MSYHVPIKHLNTSLKLLFLLVLFAGFRSLCAQNVFPKMLMSAVLPGSGEIALGQYTKGIILLTSEAIAANAFISTDRSMELQQKAYQNYAFKFAGVPLGMPRNHYQSVQEYISSEYYNSLIEMMARNYYLILYNDPVSFEQYVSENSFTGAEVWEWQSSSHWQKYQKLRRDHQKTKINHNLALGVMLLNRAVSVIDTAISGKNQAKSYQVYFSPIANDGLMLNCGISFK